MYNSILDQYNIHRLALVLAIQAEIDGMKATNTKTVQGRVPLYTRVDFDEKAEELRELANKPNEQL